MTTSLCPGRNLPVSGLLLLVPWLLLGPACPGSASEAEPWVAQIEEVIDSPKYVTARWGLLVCDLTSGQVLYERDADKLFAPASTTKLFSTAAALDAFGADARVETPLYGRGELNSQGHWAGDLILVARGDLTLGGRTEQDGRIAFKDVDHTYANGMEATAWTSPDPLAGLNELARQVAAAGIKRVGGDVLIDDRLFDSTQGSGSGPSRVTPVLVNDNLIDFLIIPTTAGSAASVEWRPRTAAVRVDIQVDTAPADQPLTLVLRASAGGAISVRGQIPAGHQPVVRVSEVEDPVAFARALLIEALGRAGVAVEANVFDPARADLLPSSKDYATLRRLASLQSPRFQEEIKLILKVSHNQHASTLPLLLAAQKNLRTLGDGLRLQRDFLASLGVDVNTISFAGGAGGTRADYVTPRATVQLLRMMARRADFDAYKMALPVLGVDGTLAKAVGRHSPARGKVYAKTGTLFYDNLLNGNYLLTSKALAGYLTTSRGRELAFALFVNHLPIAQADDTAAEGRVLGKLCEWIHDGL